MWRCGARTNQCVFPVSPSQLSLINPILAADPLHGDGWQHLCPGRDAPLSQCLTLLAQPTAEGAGTHPSSLRQLILVVAFHPVFLPFNYLAKVQKNLELCKKNLYFFRPITDNNWQCATMSDKDWQCPTSIHQFFVPLQRVRKRKTTRWKSGVDTLKSTIRHFAQARRANERENDL